MGSFGDQFITMKKVVVIGWCLTLVRVSTKVEVMNIFGVFFHQYSSSFRDPEEEFSQIYFAKKEDEIAKRGRMRLPI